MCVILAEFTCIILCVWDYVYMCVSGLSIRPFLGVSLYVGEAVKAYGTNGRRKRNAVGVTPWGVIDNHSDLIGRDVSVVL